MALTGLVVLGYLIVHALGNLLVFGGAAAIDGYAEFLQSNRALVWTVRVVLLVAIVLHVHAALTLTRAARRARPDRYATLARRASTPAARSMRAGGVLLLAFIVFHILHLTTGTVHPDFVAGAVYRNVTIGLGATPVGLFYIVAMVALGLHLLHGLWSLFQTLGLEHPHLNGFRRGVAVVLGVGLALAFVSIPVAVLAGLVR
jgi:succinate dehydrogenase / fumarate reductase cytochrome b subunit